MLSYDIGYYSERELLKLQGLLAAGRCFHGIEATGNINVPDKNNILVTIYSDRHQTVDSMLSMFSNVLLTAIFEKE